MSESNLEKNVDEYRRLLEQFEGLEPHKADLRASVAANGKYPLTDDEMRQRTVLIDVIFEEFKVRREREMQEAEKEYGERPTVFRKAVDFRQRRWRE